MNCLTLISVLSTTSLEKYNLQIHILNHDLHSVVHICYSTSTSRSFKLLVTMICCSSICRPTTSVSSILCRSWLLYLLSHQCLQYLSLWLRYYLLLYLSSQGLSCGSSIGGFVLVHGSRLLYLLMLRYLSFVAPVSVVRGSSGGSWLSLMAPVLSNVTSCGSKLSLVAPVAAMVVFPPVALTGNHLVFW